MKNASKNGKQVLATFFLLLALLVTGFSVPPSMECNCSSPEVAITSQGNSAISFSWGAVSGATEYKVWYVRQDIIYTSAVTTTSGTSVSFTSLPAGTYKFYFQTNCGGDLSQISILDDLVMM